MKTRNLMQIAVTAAALALATSACKPSENTGTTTPTAVATPAPTPDTAAIVAEITRIENDFPRVIREKDGAAVRRVEADDVMLVYPDGSAGNKEQDIKDIEAGLMTFEAWDLSDMKVNVIDNDTAIAGFLITVTNGKIKTPDGSQDISGKYRVIDTFVRRNGQWQLVGSSVTPLLKTALAALAAASPTASPAATSSPATKASPAPKAAPTRRPPPPPPAASPTNNQ